jgi:hypothetical protein
MYNFHLEQDHIKLLQFVALLADRAGPEDGRRGKEGGRSPGDQGGEGGLLRAVLHAAPGGLVTHLRIADCNRSFSIFELYRISPCTDLFHCFELIHLQKETHYEKSIVRIREMSCVLRPSPPSGWTTGASAPVVRSGGGVGGRVGRWGGAILPSCVQGTSTIPALARGSN